MQKELNKIIKEISGNVVVIGLDNKLLEKLEQNDNILNCYSLGVVKEGKRKFGFGSKTIKIKNIRKKFKKKKIDYVICEYDVIKKYLNTFVKDSVYINKNKLYFYGNVNIELIKDRYNRYDTTIEVKEYKDKYIVSIDNQKAKNNLIKDTYYRMYDFINKTIELIGDILMG